jgi:putative transposase
MNFINHGKHTRRSIRLPGYDYSKPGAYFVTICVQNRECLLGEIENKTVRLNEFGTIVRETWEWLANHYPYIRLDEFVVMPNHFHGILWIQDVSCRGGSRTASTKKQDDENSIEIPANNATKIKPVGRIIGAFKTVSSKQINIRRKLPGVSFWQRDFYDHIGRDENELVRIRQYIRKNPEIWDSDGENVPCKSPRYVAMPNPQKQYQLMD